MKIVLPDPCLVALVGASGSGKSTFASKHFRPTEVLSSDFFRAMVADDESDQAASKDAFDLLHAAAAKRLAHWRFTVIDATNVRREARKQLLDLARQHHAPAAAIVFNLPRSLCEEFDRQRTDRHVGHEVIARHSELLHRSLETLEKEGFHPVHILHSVEEVAAAVIHREPLPVDRRDLRGPFDVIGDVHGCFEELLDLLWRLDYEITELPGVDGRPEYAVRPPPGRMALFVGDLVDRGPRIPDVLRLVMDMVAAGTALCVCGNHDDKLRRRLAGRDVRVSHGLAATLEQLDAEPAPFRDRVLPFLEGLQSHLVLDGGRLIVAHAGLTEDLHGRVSAKVRSFCLYGDTTGATDSFGMPVRRDWGAEYRGRAVVIYGHTPVAQAEWLNKTINIDTGCVFGGRLTALRYPENELFSIPAQQKYCEPGRPFLPPCAAAEPKAVEPPRAPGHDADGAGSSA
jgi:protein phosphatase